ncbi:hypothetical protein M378DRAFT_162896 [Amanita muscaria Koide BX008]|uniref:Uncharacterized protein n=1 Tax=Amanita muscaria (strain Koide BX008) TaxID=946122 RepID=A0A0C2SND8_AMAMK|nr:hypothetical protein M378DRAFT_162896 [Amanita muscaria Koide BX008]
MSVHGKTSYSKLSSSSPALHQLELVMTGPCNPQSFKEDMTEPTPSSTHPHFCFHFRHPLTQYSYGSATE